MYTIDFEYAGEKLSDYGMMVCRFDSGGLETVSSGADITFNQVKPSMSNKFNLYSSTYDSAYTTTFQICKNPCMKVNDRMSISTIEISGLQRWLCRKNQYNRFKIEQKDYEQLYWNATFSAKQIELNGETVGLELTMYTDAPFAYMDELILDYDCSSKKHFDIYDVSDEEGYIYPYIKITCLEHGDFTLVNSMNHDKLTIVNNCTSGETIILDGRNQIIKSSVSSHRISNDFNYLFPKIINTYNENLNTFTVSLNCLISISYSPIRKVGL